MAVWEYGMEFDSMGVWNGRMVAWGYELNGMEFDGMEFGSMGV